MKKNVTVNIFGSLYPMDEDAYAMLNAYIINMRDYFSRRPDGKEIADDIEARAAELMSDLMNSGVEAISIEHVNDIIGRIGNPEQMNYDESEDNISEETQTDAIDENEETAQPAKRKLFRNPDHKIFGGVCSGIGRYFGIKPIWLRMLALLLIWPTFGIIIAVYLLCWLLIPLASTPAERLQMKGKPVTVSNICEEFLCSARDIIDRTGTFGFDNNVSRGLISFFKWIMYGLGILLVIFCILTLLGLIFSLVCAISAPWNEMRDVVRSDFPILMIIDSNPLWLISICCASLLVLLILTLVCIVHFMFHLLGKVKAMSSKLRISCIILWVISLLVFLISSSNVVSNVGIHYAPSIEEYKEQEAKHEAEKEAKELEYLENAGWSLIKNENLIKRYTLQGEHFSGDSNVRYLDGAGSDGSMGMAYEVARQQKVAPGKYRLHAAVRANGQGAEIFAVNGNGLRLSMQIPVCGNEGGSIWQNAKNALEADTTFSRPDREYLEKIVNANDKRGFGWSEVVIDNIIVGSDSIITYGVTNVSSSRTWEGTWLSATAFELRKDN